jgi:hypothetical protein
MVTRRPARISAASTCRPARLTRPAGVHGPVDLGRAVVRIGGRQGWRAGGTAATGGEQFQVMGGQVRAQRLDPGAGDQQVDDLAVGPEGDRDAGPVGAEPELPAGHAEVAAGGHDAVTISP